MKKILIFSPANKVGGIGRLLSEYGNNFAKKGHQVFYASLVGGFCHYQLSEKIELIEFKQNRNNPLQRLLFNLSLFFFVRKVVKKVQPDVILSMSDTFNPIVLCGTLTFSAPVYIGDVNHPERKLQLKTRIGKRLFYRRAKGFIAQTQFAMQVSEKKWKLPHKKLVLNGFVKPIKTYPVERENLVLCVGRLSFEKAQDRLIEAFAKTVENHSWKLGLTSSGPMEQKLKSMVKNLCVEDRVIFYGNVPDIDELYNRTSIFVLPSRTEGFPNALVEAMAAGLPVITFDSFPADEVVTHGVNGLIVPDNDLDKLAVTIETLINSKDKRNQLGVEAKKIVETHNLDVVAAKLEKFILDEAL